MQRINFVKGNRDSECIAAAFDLVMQSTVLNHGNQKAKPTWEQISLHFTVNSKQEKKL